MNATPTATSLRYAKEAPGSASMRRVARTRFAPRCQLPQRERRPKFFALPQPETIGGQVRRPHTEAQRGLQLRKPYA